MPSTRYRGILTDILTVLTALAVLILVFVRVRESVRTSEEPLLTPTTVAEWRRYARQGQRLGTIRAPVTIVEFSDFQCPFCQRFAQSLRQIRQEFGQDLAVVYRHFPIHEHAAEAARAAECAGRFGRFEEMHDLLFAEAESIGAKPWGDFGLAANISDADALLRCMEDSSIDRILERDSIAAAALRVTGTPTVLINDKMFGGALGPKQLKREVRKALADAKKAEI